MNGFEDPGPMTHLRPLVRPVTGFRLCRIPFAASQAAKVPPTPWAGEGAILRDSSPRVAARVTSLIHSPFHKTAKLFEVDNTATERVDDRLGSILDAEFREERLHMSLHRLLGNEEGPANITIAAAFCQMLEDFKFSGG